MRPKAVFVTPRMHADIRVHAAQKGVTISEVVANAIFFWLETERLNAIVADKTKPKKNGKR